MRFAQIVLTQSVYNLSMTQGVLAVMFRELTREPGESRHRLSGRNRKRNVESEKIPGEIHSQTQHTQKPPLVRD